MIETPVQQTPAPQGVSIIAIAQGLLDAEKMINHYRKLHAADIDPAPMRDAREEDIRKMVGAKLRIMRKLRGFSQVDLAKKIGATQSTITNVENGRRAPSLKNLVGLSKALNVSVDWLLDIPAPAPEPTFTL